jgi:choline dehydrogenase-like flavoprotein
LDDVYDYVIVGSGFGGSVAALRLAEKGYSVLVLERGKRFADADFASSNWQFWKYLWAPPVRAFGILQVSVLKGVMVLHGAGVGGGSLGYANVLEVPAESTFATGPWNVPVSWGEGLKPHFETAKRMLGVVPNPRLWKADEVLREISVECGMGHTFRPAEVGVFFGEPGKKAPDPYFDGNGPERTGCRHCGGCMVGCRYNAKNTLPKNYIFLAERLGGQRGPGSRSSGHPAAVREGTSRTGEPLRSGVPFRVEPPPPSSQRSGHQRNRVSWRDRHVEAAPPPAGRPEVAAEAFAATGPDGADQLRGAARFAGT